MVEHLAEVAGHVARELVGKLETAVEDGGDRGALGRHALLGEGDAVTGFLERGGPGKLRDPIMGQRTPEQRDEPLGQALGFGVQRAQKGV